MRAGILQALARLYQREGVWRGTLAEWWGTRPDTTGPYYDPVTWDESPRILAALRRAVLQTRLDPANTHVPRLMQDLERNRVVPPGAGDLLAAVKLARDAALPELADALLGALRLDVDAKRAPLFARLAGQRLPIVRRSSRCWLRRPVTPAAGEILRRAAIDASADAQTRATALACAGDGDGHRRARAGDRGLRERKCRLRRACLPRSTAPGVSS